MCCATNKSNVNTSKNQQESLSISPENSGETIDYVEFMVIMRVKCQCNKSSIMISAEQRRLELFAVTVLLYLVPITNLQTVSL